MPLRAGVSIDDDALGILMLRFVREGFAAWRNVLDAVNPSLEVKQMPKAPLFCCQVREGSTVGGMISGTRSTSNPAPSSAATFTAPVAESGTYMLDGVVEVDTLVTLPLTDVTCSIQIDGTTIGEEISITVASLIDQAIPLTATGPSPQATRSASVPSSDHRRCPSSRHLLGPPGFIETRVGRPTGITGGCRACVGRRWPLGATELCRGKRAT